MTNRMNRLTRSAAIEDLVTVGLADEGVPPPVVCSSARQVCPVQWAGRTERTSDGEFVFVCGACNSPNMCAADGCVRVEVIEPDRPF